MSPRVEQSDADSDPRTGEIHAIDGVRLRLRLWGDSSLPPIVLLHGGGANASWWTALAPKLADQFHCIALDFRGHGDSEAPTPVVGAFQRDVAAVARTIGEGPFALVGHSMGAHVALEFAAQNSGVSHVVAIEVSRGAAKNTSRRARIALAARRTYKTREDAITRYRFLPETREVSETLRREIAEQSVRQEPDGRFAYKFDPGWFRLESAAPAPRANITASCLILRGEASPLLTQEGASAFVEEIPNARMLEIPDAGHNVHLECPDETARAVIDHLLRSN